MGELFFNFDDELFEIKKKTKNYFGYNDPLQIIPPTFPCFFENKESQENKKDEVKKNLKAKADYFYFNHQYEQAFFFYLKFKESINRETGLMRSCEEDVVMCLIKLKKEEQAEKHARELVSTAENNDQLMTSIDLLIKTMKNEKNKIKWLKIFLLLHPHSSYHWHQLAKSSLCQIPPDEATASLAFSICFLQNEKFNIRENFINFSQLKNKNKQILKYLSFLQISHPESIIKWIEEANKKFLTEETYLTSRLTFQNLKPIISDYYQVNSIFNSLFSVPDKLKKAIDIKNKII